MTDTTAGALTADSGAETTSSPLPVSIRGIKLTAIAQGYYRVLVNGVEVSRHAQEREAIDRAADAKIGAPLSDVRYTHAYEVKVELE